MLFHENRLLKYHALFVVFEKVATLNLSSAANYRWRFMGKLVTDEPTDRWRDKLNIMHTKLSSFVFHRKISYNF